MRNERNKEYNLLLLRRTRSAPNRKRTGAPVTSPEVMPSLPIRERTSALERMRQERNKEYNRLMLRRSDESDDVMAAVTSHQPEVLSLPIKERTSAQLRMRKERNREYNALMTRRSKSALAQKQQEDMRLKPVIKNKHPEPSKGTQTPPLLVPTNDETNADDDVTPVASKTNSDWLEEVVDYVKV